MHTAASTYRAKRDINIPYGFQQFCNSETRIARLEPLVPLQRKDQFQVFCFGPVVQEPIIPNLPETGREHMHQVATDEFRVFKGNGPPGLTGAEATGRESHTFIIHGKDAAVGDSNLVGMSAEIFNGITEAVESLLYVGAPVLIIKGMAEFFPVMRIPEGVAGRRKGGFAFAVQFVQAGKELTLEFIP